ncbi:MAG TPA: MFS transporter [Candidatus Saccharimonadales bacterium]
MAETEHVSAQAHAATFSKKMRMVALIVVSLAFVMDLLDSTIVNIAIPSIQTNLGASYAAIQWLIAGYALTFALLLVTGGRMGDVFGYKKIFMIGVGGFTIASLLSGIAPNPALLIVARLLQGSMAALMVPQVMSLMQIMYKPEERGAINGLFGALGGLAASLGPVIGGLLIKANVFGWDWRPIFLINVPIGIFGLLAAAKYLPNGKSEHPLKLDLVGTGIIMAAMVLLVFPLIQGRDLDWPIWTFIMMAAAAPVFVLFAWWQRKKDAMDHSPLVLPSLFKSRSFGLGLGVNLLFEAAMLGFFLTSTLLFQIGIGFSAIHAALTGLPLAFGIALTMGLAGKVIPKLGRRAINIGTAIMAVGVVTFSAVSHHYGLGIHSWQFIPGLLIVGIGMGFVFASLFAAVLNDVDPRDAGSASGALNAVQQVGGAIGIAVIGVLFFGQLHNGAVPSFATQENALRSSLTAEHVPASVQTSIVNSTKQCFVDRSQEKDSSKTPPSCQQSSASKASHAVTATITKAAEQANNTNFNRAFRWTVGYELCMMAIVFTLALFLPKRFKASAYNEI